MNVALTLAANVLGAIASTLFIAGVTKLALRYVDVVSERTVVWCITLGYVLGSGSNAEWRTKEPFGPTEAVAFGNAIGHIVALLLLWYFLYRWRQPQDGEWS